MSAATEAYERLLAAQHSRSLMTDEQRRFEEQELERARNRDQRNRLIRRKLGKVY